MWFFTAHRRWGTSSEYPNFYPNLTQGSNLYTPDSNNPTLPVETNRSNSVRLTWQASPKNKLTFYVDNQASCNCPNNETTLVSPEATSPVPRSPIFLTQISWTNVTSSKFLFEAGFTSLQFKYNKRLPPGVGPNDRAVTDRGFTYQAPVSLLLLSEPDTYNARGSASYVTGSHHFKAGFWMFEGTSHQTTARNGGGVNYTFLSGVPQSLTEFISPLTTLQRQWPTYSLYVQDQWTMGRLTANYGLRFEYLREYVPAEQQPAVPQFAIPARSFPLVTCVPCWKDANPRFSVAYDLFGNGHTALKGSVGRYVAAEANSISSANDPVNATVSSATRSFSDDNNNLQPDCDLTNPLKNGECGQINPLGFGGPKAVNVYDPSYLNGWGKRGFSWLASARIDQQLRPGLGVSAGYYRTWYGNFLVTDNLLVATAELQPLLHHGADRRAARQRQREPDLRSLRRRPAAFWPDPELHYVRIEIRKTVPALQRCRSQRQCTVRAWRVGARRDQHRESKHRPGERLDWDGRGDGGDGHRSRQHLLRRRFTAAVVPVRRQARLRHTGQTARLLCVAVGRQGERELPVAPWTGVGRRLSRRAPQKSRRPWDDLLPVAQSQSRSSFSRRSHSLDHASTRPTSDWPRASRSARRSFKGCSTSTT